MRTMIQIRNVPLDLHRRAKARAALEGITLSDFAKEALRRAVEQPTMAEIAARIRQLEPVDSRPSAAELVREERDSR
jgi:antitoxin FitA